VSQTVADRVQRSPVRLDADRSRVIARLFVPGQEGFEHQESRTSPVLERILALDETEVKRALDDVMVHFEHRHRDLEGIFTRHAAELADRLDPRVTLSDQRRLLLGATFTSEYAIEGAALCNPSIVAHPDQTGAPAGGLRFVMSVRAIGEGHRSSIGFRTGAIDARGNATPDEPPAFATTAQVEPSLVDASVFRGELDRLHISRETADYVLDALGEQFTAVELEQRLGRLRATLATRRHSGGAIPLIRRIAERSYGARFAAGSALTERVLWPAMGAEGHGMEDARFVRFVDEAGRPTYYATYTAFDGADISQQLLETADFESFTSSPLVGPAAANKGLALFPRRIDGRFVALSRADRETNGIAWSDNPRRWDDAPVRFQVPTRSWEAVQLGNCGSPIETEAGWLVLTHGVGPMRTYSIGAIMLDLEEPTRVIGCLREPLLRPTTAEQNGYVPNVVYSCGALVHASTLVLPYGIGDAAIGIATIGLPDLLAALEARPGLPGRRTGLGR
jgi:predicted GH43/DUF377 family glycosyl hydrolase